MASFPVANATIASLKPFSKQENIVRRDAKYHPSVWGDYFIKYLDQSTDHTSTLKRMEILKEEVRAMVRSTKDVLNLIDWLHRTGIGYHFEKEINEALEHVYEDKANIYATVCCNQYSDLHRVALTFRLLRQHGHYVSTDAFKRFMDDRGKFKDSIADDIRGMLSLYEASYMSVKGEVTLDEALAFTSERLNAALPNLRGPLAQQVSYALDTPLHRCTERLKARRSISCYEEENGRNEIVLELAKLDFNLLQAMHQRELAELTRWYKGLDVASKLPFSRDRVAELYFWTLETLPEPRYSRARRIMLKCIVIASFLDDVYDVYGTLEELQLFTLLIESDVKFNFGSRWDMQASKQLPECMKIVYSIILKMFTELEELLKPEELYRISYLRQAMLPFIRSQFVEAQWFYSQYFPKFKEYMDNGIISSGYPFLAVVSLIGLDEIATKDVFEWVIKMPSIVHAASIICRNRDDIVGYKEEQEKGHIPTGVECYMKDHGCTEEQACKALQTMVDDAWKQINYELLHNTSLPRAFLMRAVNLARFILLLYRNRDGYSHSSHETKAYINLVLVQPIPL